jgi:uncharacterized membrane protein YdbT with pleckstrin-like domain
MKEELIQDKKYSLGKRAFWFLFFKHNKKFFLAIIIFSSMIYGINTPAFSTWFASFNTLITINILNLWIGALIFSCLILIFASTFERYMQHKFMLGEHSFHIRRGIFMIKEKVIPYRHIQNVDIDQPYHYRLLGLAKLDITTARTDNFEDEKSNLIPLIDKRLARKLSDFLIKQGVVSHQSMIRQTESQEIVKGEIVTEIEEKYINQK